jgi:hypothetical protein
MARTFNLKNIRTFFSKGFSDEELRRLCFDEPEFKPVFEKLSQGMGKDRIIDELIQYAERRELIEPLLDVAEKLNPAGYERYQPYYDDSMVGPTTSRSSYPDTETQFQSTEASTHFVSAGMNALIRLMQAPQVRAAVVAFQTDFQAACEQIDILTDHKRLHDLFQELESRYNLVDHDRKHLETDETAWDSLMLIEPEIQTTTDELLNVANQAAFAADESWWTQQLDQTRQELRQAVENIDPAKLKSAAHRLYRVLTREPSRINARLVATAGSLRLSALVKALSIVHSSLTQPDLDLEAARQFQIGLEALTRLDSGLKTLVSNHNIWQDVDDELRRVEANLGQDTGELELAWLDLKSMTDTLCHANEARWAVDLNQVSAALDSALATETPVKVRHLFRRYRSQAGQRFRQVDQELLTLCRELQKIGASLNLVLRIIE